MNNKQKLPDFFTTPEYFSFFSIMNNAYTHNWNGIMLLNWDSLKIKGSFRNEDYKTLITGKAHIIFCEGQVINVYFSPKPLLNLLNNKSALKNLLLLIRVFEGIVDQPKIKAAAAFERTNDVLQLPKVIEIDCNSIIGYSLLANEQALKDKIESEKWPDILE
jgi:hypothetical protein